MKLFSKKNYFNNGFEVIQNVISAELISDFKKEIGSFTRIQSKLKKINKKKEDKFSICLKNFKNRKVAYQLLQDLRSVKKISDVIDKSLYESGVYQKLNFKAPSIKNGLIISLPNEGLYDNPLHQDIYNYNSKKFIKIWAPLTPVNSINGSMKVFQGSHELGFIKPEYKKLEHYPEIDEAHTKNYNSVTFEMKPGPIVIFNPLIIHGSIANKSNRSRFIFGSDIQDVADIPFNPQEKFFREMRKISIQRSNKRKKINY